MNKLQQMLVVIMLSAIPCTSNAQITLLDADFENQTPGVVIGTGGPAVGEPVTVQTISAYPATNCYGSQCLVVLDNSSEFSSWVIFEHALGGDLDEGTIVVQFDIAVQGPNAPNLRVRDDSGNTLHAISFANVGPIHVNGNWVANWVPLQQMSIQIVYDFTAGISDVYIDDIPVLEFEPITADGVASFMIQDTDPFMEGYVLLDNLKIIDIDETYTGVPNGERPYSLVAFPNPFRASTAIQFATKSASRVNLSIYDVAGRLVRVLSDGTRSGGTHIESWDGRDTRGNTVSAGVYFSRVDVDGAAETKRLTLVR